MGETKFRLKNDKVNIKDLSPMMKASLKVIKNIVEDCERKDYTGYEMTITSGKDGKHMKGSKHYSGNAIDIRIKDMKSDIVILVNRLKNTLGRNFDVIKEIDHIHVEYDEK